LNPDSSRPHFARKRFLVKPALQFKSLGFVLLIVFLSSVGVYVVFESTLWNSLSLLPLSELQTATLAASLRLSFFFMLLILLAACGVESYLYFHRIIGPLFVLERELKRIAEGDLDHEVRLRTGDELKDIFQTLDDLKKSLKERAGRETQLLQEAEKALGEMAREFPSHPRLVVLQKNFQTLREALSGPRP